MPKGNICIHAHFYQPPRENPWLEEVEREKSAAPFHDWNQRITRECYAANGTARILKEGKIDRIVNNYEKISFNFGPTLLSWLERHEPDVYRMILEADRESVNARNGHGNGIAQSYNHSIMPLNSRRDKETQIIWGIRDFQSRFGRKPEGMWFAETAVDSETLMLAAEHGIKFTILAPRQAAKIRSLEPAGKWSSAHTPPDSSKPYLFRGADGEGEIAVFFYDGALAHSVAFGGALHNGIFMGADFVKKAKKTSGGLLHIATDGESFGHHHQFGEMALSAAVRVIENSGKAVLTNYGKYLEEHPPAYEVEIVENSSWSCEHGVERWKADCGCSTGNGPGWNQKWRAPLREGLANLQERLDAVFEKEASRYLRSPWEARNDYIDVLLERGGAGSFVSSHSSRPLAGEEVCRVVKLMEMQVHAMKMFTSCGWFFNDVSGIETVQVMKYAARAIELAGEFTETDLETGLLGHLEKAKSNIGKYGTGADIYRKSVKPTAASDERIAGRTVIMNSLDLEKDNGAIYSHDFEIVDKHREEQDLRSLMVGRIKLVSHVTLEKKDYKFSLIYFGGHDFNCFLVPFEDEARFEKLKTELLSSFRKHSATEIIRAVEKYFPEECQTFASLFEGERMQVMETLTDGVVKQVGDAYSRLFSRHRKLMEHLLEIDVPLPEEFRVAAKYVFEKKAETLFADSDFDEDCRKLTDLLDNARKWEVGLNLEKMLENLSAFLQSRIQNLCEEGDPSCVGPVIMTLEVLRKYEVDFDTRQFENELYPYYLALKESEHKLHELVSAGDSFKKLLRLLDFYV